MVLTSRIPSPSTFAISAPSSASEEDLEPSGLLLWHPVSTAAEHFRCLELRHVYGGLGIYALHSGSTTSSGRRQPGGMSVTTVASGGSPAELKFNFRNYSIGIKGTLTSLAQERSIRGIQKIQREDLSKWAQKLHPNTRPSRRSVTTVFGIFSSGCSSHPQPGTDSSSRR